MDNKKYIALEEQFNNDCKIIEFKYEYPGYTDDIPFGIITALTEEELKGKYGEILNAYRPFILLDTSYGEVRADYIRNQDKHNKRQGRRGSYFEYDAYTEHCHCELLCGGFEDDSITKYALQAAIAKLTPIQQEDVISFFILGMSVKEIAQKRGVTPQAISISIENAKKRLKKSLSTT